MTGFLELYRYFLVVSGDGKSRKGVEVRGDVGIRLEMVWVVVALVTF